MAQIDISQALGDFMLKGYVYMDHSCISVPLTLLGQVLTNQTCPTPGCAIPILRTPRGKIPVVTFCVECSDGGPSSANTFCLFVILAYGPSSGYVSRGRV